MPKKQNAPVSVRSSDLASAITQPKGTYLSNKGLVEVIRYDFRGRDDQHHKNKISEEQACAQKTIADRNFIYKIKSRRGGKLYNPLVNGRDGLVAVDKANNNRQFQFREVNRDAFESYVKFLQTGYDSYLLRAEREA